MTNALTSIPLPIVVAAMGLALVFGMVMGLCLRRPKRPSRWENGSALRSYEKPGAMPIDWQAMKARDMGV